MEIENIRILMVKVPPKQQTTTKMQRNFNKGRTKEECDSIAGSKLQTRISKPREMKMKDDAAAGQQQNRVWDPRGRD